MRSRPPCGSTRVAYPEVPLRRPWQAPRIQPLSPARLRAHLGWRERTSRTWHLQAERVARPGIGSREEELSDRATIGAARRCLGLRFALSARRNGELDWPMTRWTLACSARPAPQALRAFLRLGA